MKKVLILAVVLMTGCSAVPAPKYQATVKASDCRAVEGAPARMAKNGQLAHKYICNGQSVWAVKI